MRSIYTKLRKKYKSLIFKIRVVYITRINTLLLLRNLYTLQHIFAPKKVIAALSIITLASSWMPIYNLARAANDKIVYPIQEMSKLNCRFQKFSDLSKECKRSLPILKTKDYKKYIKTDGGYNDYTRIYTVLWGASYKYGWDVGNGGHMGTDIATAEGTPVYSIAKGKVINAQYMKSWGNTVSVEHIIDGKKIVSNYAHLSKISVKYGEKVGVGEKLGEVGNTGNSFGNHLHFQIDLDTSFHPYYYDYTACPYPYSKISESDICFGELSKNTIDPLAFLESKGAILDKVIYTSNVVGTEKSSGIHQYTSSTVSSKPIPDILYTYVHIDSDESDIKDLQKVFKEMGLYKGSKSGHYVDLKQTLIAYQINRGVIENKDSVGAGYFGPKTREQAQSDYREFSQSGESFNNPMEFKTSSFGGGANKARSKIENNIKVEKISKKDVLTREEIEQREIDSFRRNFQIDLQLEGSMGNIGLGNTETIKFTINNSKGRPYKGRTPSDITIETDTNLLKVFPNRLYQFTDGKRDIKVTGLKKGVSSLNVKIGDTILKSFKINVFDGDVSIYPTSGSVLSSKKIVYGEEKTGFVVMKDDNYTNLINLKFKGKFLLKSDTNTQFCLKKTDLQNIKKSLAIRCKPEEFKNEISFDYADTAAGILVFDYKVEGKNANMKLINTSDNTQFSQKNFLVTAPKGLSKEYAYSDEVIKLLKQGIVGGISKGYFLEERDLSQADAYTWIENTLVELKDSTDSVGKREQIQKRIDDIRTDKTSKYSYLTRKAFLEKATELLVFDDNIPEVTIKYKDLDKQQNKQANLVFDADNTWKDKFGDNYYRPKETITRGEGAYLISRVLEKKTNSFVTLK